MYIHQLLRGEQVEVPDVQVVKPGKEAMVDETTQNIAPDGKIVVLVIMQLPVGPLVVVQPTVNEPVKSAQMV